MSRLPPPNEKVVIILILALALGYVLLTGPFRGADERNHFFRAFHVSEGGVLAIRGPDGVVGYSLPTSLLTLAQAAGALTNIPEMRTSSQQLHAAALVPLYSNDRTPVNFPNTALYSPLNNFPAAIGIDIRRIFSANPLLLFYLARIFSALFAVCLFAFGINLLPLPGQSLRVFALIPMVLFQAGMITADWQFLPFHLIISVIGPTPVVFFYFSRRSLSIACSGMLGCQPFSRRCVLVPSPIP